ncbi:glycosyltransferase [Luteolibacter marinus]|uniref:glycosyltransferase n=1 Tax=Luteolibacter marinus TaxID=2776705 RepID=UPI00186841C3
MRFSVIIAARNAAATLEETLDSIHRQEFRDFEVILVDDASTDSTVQLAARHPLEPTLVTLPLAAGPGSARNHGARLASGDYLTFLDADDFWFPWTLSVLDEAIRANPGSSFLAGRAKRGSGGFPNPGGGRSAMEAVRFSDYFETSPRHLWIGVGGTAIERSAFNLAGGFATWCGNGEDSDLWLRLGKTPGFIELKSPELFYYRATDDSLTRRPDRIAAGCRGLVGNESQGHYPGGVESRRRRLTLITRHTRSASLELLRHGRLREAVDLYLSTFPWNLSLFRLKYLAGFWLVWAKHPLKTAPGGPFRPTPPSRPVG